MTDGDREEAAEFLIVQPALEPWPEFMRRLGGWAVFAYFRWSCFAVGIDVMSAGAALHFGPLMFGVAKIKPQLAAFDAKQERIAERLPTGFALLDPAQFRK